MTAETRLMVTIEQFIARPVRWYRRQAELAMDAVTDEYINELHRKAGRDPATLGSGSPSIAEWGNGGVFHAYEPKRCPTGLATALTHRCVERWEDGPPIDPTVAAEDQA
jgi:hypothetical protein